MYLNNIYIQGQTHSLFPLAVTEQHLSVFRDWKDLWKDLEKFLYFRKKAKYFLHEADIFSPLISAC